RTPTPLRRCRNSIDTGGGWEDEGDSTAKTRTRCRQQQCTQHRAAEEGEGKGSDRREEGDRSLQSLRPRSVCVLLEVVDQS
ncbi:unnamed protein product, partial [Musa textilis]